MLKDQEQFAEAASAYLDALAIRPHDAEAHNNLGNAYLAQGRLDDAAAREQRADGPSEGQAAVGVGLGRAGDVARLFPRQAWARKK